MGCLIEAASNLDICRILRVNVVKGCCKGHKTGSRVWAEGCGAVRLWGCSRF